MEQEQRIGNTERKDKGNVKWDRGERGGDEV